MTNKERQEKLDQQKWLKSEKEFCDKTGEMPYCFHCLYQTQYLACQATQEERENGCICAKAWNKMVRKK